MSFALNFVLITANVIYAVKSGILHRSSHFSSYFPRKSEDVGKNLPSIEKFVSPEKKCGDGSIGNFVTHQRNNRMSIMANPLR